MNNLPSTFFTYDKTESFSKISCLAWMYPLHILCAYILVLAGIVALLTRLIPRFKWLHVYAGRTFMMTMYFTEGSSILIYNTGLPRAIAGFMCIMLFTMTTGFGIIRYVQTRFAKDTLTRADELFDQYASASALSPASGGETRPMKQQRPSELVAVACDQLLNAPRPWHKRFFSLKALHGLLMTIAWYQMAGRAMVTNPAKDWKGCWTYPAIKDFNGTVTLVPEHDPSFFRNETMFFNLITWPSITFFILVGIAYSCIASRNQRKHPYTSSPSLDDSSSPYGTASSTIRAHHDRVDDDYTKDQRYTNMGQVEQPTQ
eukprot:TRINITY_DN2681_c0_g1_i2.p1 TRINITY_DN2681_c0_g1~~TRINITY_DN2681_c0_g1_i2.p1  ORF type:complete len:316 (+),score=74.86 TRINITY_DN2681_c0_g1_i2:218-1165(+)